MQELPAPLSASSVSSWQTSRGRGNSARIPLQDPEFIQNSSPGKNYFELPCDRKRVQPGTLVHVPGEVGHVMKTILC